jgi:hypothetical protein
MSLFWKTLVFDDVLDTILYDKICRWLATGRWLSPVSSTNKADRYIWNIVESGAKHQNPTIKPSDFAIDVFQLLTEF